MADTEMPKIVVPQEQESSNYKSNETHVVKISALEQEKEQSETKVSKTAVLQQEREQSGTQVAEMAVLHEQKKQSEDAEDKIDVKLAEGNGELKNEDEIEIKEVAKAKKGEAFESIGDVLSLLSSPSHLALKSASFKEESNLLSDLKDHEKKALFDLRSKIEEAILGNELFKVKKDHVQELKIAESLENEADKTAESTRENAEEKEKSKKGRDENDTELEEEGRKEKTQLVIEEKEVENIEIWGVSLLPSKGDKGTDVILLKFLRAREFKVNDAFEMLRNTLQWRKENSIESILDEDYGADLASLAYMNGVDRQGHPICYNVYGGLVNDELYNKIFGTEPKVDKFLRWRFQLMEKGIQKLDFKPGGVSSLLQINDLKNSPGPSRKELRLATKRAVGLLQDNYPEFVARNIFINVPFWYYAFNALLSPFLTQRTKSKFVFARPSRVTETLLKYIAAEQIPVQYGGLKRENDSDFSIEDGVWEVFVKGGSTETIEIPAQETGSTITWDLSVLGWEVNYKEEFVPTDEGSYTLIVSKGRKMGGQEVSIRNSFRNNEPGKVVLTIENGSFKKKRVLYRYRTKN